MNGDSLTISNWTNDEPGAEFPKQTCTLADPDRNGEWRDADCKVTATPAVKKVFLPLCERPIPSGNITTVRTIL